MLGSSLAWLAQTTGWRELGPADANSGGGANGGVAAGWGEGGVPPW